MRPLALRTKLTLFYAITVSVLLTGFALIYYNRLSAGLDNDLTQEVLDRAEGLHSYLRFDEEGQPIFTYDPDDPDEVTFVKTATRYYQVYDIKKGTLLQQSEEFKATAVVYSAPDILQYAQKGVSLFDVQTDEGRLRL